MSIIIEAEHPYSYTDDDGVTISFKQGERFILINKSNEDWWKVQRTGLFVGKTVCYVPAAYVKEVNTTPQGEKKSQHVNLDVYKKIIAKDFDGLSRLHMVEVDSVQTPTHQGKYEGKEDDIYEPEDEEEYEDETFEDESLEEISKDVGKINLPSSFDLDEPPTPTSLLSFEISPRIDRMKSFTLPSGWKKCQDQASGRSFYMNDKAERTWKPPRRTGLQGSKSTSQLQALDPPVVVPSGWVIDKEEVTEDLVYVNTVTNERWKSCLDKHGRTYYYNIDGEGTAWDLPEITSQKPTPLRRKSMDELEGGAIRRHLGTGLANRSSKCQSVIMRSPSSLSSEEEKRSPRVSPLLPKKNNNITGNHQRNSSNLSNEGYVIIEDERNAKNMKVPEKEGPLYRRRVTEGGRPVKKPLWQQLYCCKYGSALVFYKDQKSANAKGGLIGKPESSLDLHGAKLDHVSKEKAKGKKNVFQIRSYRGQTVQQFIADSEVDMAHWLTSIQTTIKRLEDEEPLPDIPDQPDGEPEKLAPQNQLSPIAAGGRPTSPAIPKHLNTGDKESRFKGFSRRLSKKIIQSSGSTSTDEENKTKIKNKLKKYLSRRPSFTDLEDQGIIKDYVFGCAIGKLCEREESLIPKFIVQIIAEIENRGLEVEGLYRVPGNLSMINKLRVMVDHGEHIDFKQPQWEDIHLLAGSLKLYFRELPEPLIPFDMYEQFINIMRFPSPHEKLKLAHTALRQMPTENRETLTLLITHLKRVLARSSQNKMRAQNLAIVFGPTLLWPKVNDASNVAMTTVYQAQLVEFLIVQCADLFPGL